MGFSGYKSHLPAGQVNSFVGQQAVPATPWRWVSRNMAIRRKGRRSITVDSVMYHYLVAFERSERVVIQSATGLGSFLFVFPFAIMKPSHLAAAIRFGLLRGWKLTESGHNCWLVFDVDDEDQSHFEHLSSDDFRVVTHSLKGKLPANVDEAQFSDTRPWYNRPSPATGTQ